MADTQLSAVDSRPSAITSQVDIPGYTEVREIASGSSSIVYSAVRDGRHFAVKLLREGFEMEVQRGLHFRREAAAIARIDHANVIKVVEVGEFQRRSYLAMELIVGDPLSVVLQRGALPETKVVALARSIAQALAEVHRHGLVHRDIKPANILISSEGVPKLIDFGFVGETSKEEEDQREVRGTLMYAPPEQNGTLKRPVDARSDLYSLGILLFECLTGRLPFSGATLTDLIRQHAAVPLPSPHSINPEVGRALSAIVCKLAAKDPDERYQSATGLDADLANLAPLEEATRSGTPLSLGSRDLQRIDLGEIALVGRHEELAVLQDTWKNVVRGTGTVLQVEGESGSGKSRLVRELVRFAEASGALILAGKCQKGDAVPFGPLREAVDTLIGSAVRRQPQEQEQLLAAIRNAASDFGGIIRRLCRGLERVLNQQDAAPLRNSESEQERFYEQVGQFFANFPEAFGKPVVLVVDDTQWLDTGSLAVLRKLRERFLKSPLLILTTARNDDESEAQRAQFVQEMGGPTVCRVVLRPLDQTSTGELIAAHLGGAQLNPTVVDRIRRASNGNAFVIGQFIRAMLDSGSLRPVAGVWHADEDRLNEVTLSKDVVALVLHRLAGLDQCTQRLLQYAACVGNQFKVSVAAAAAQLGNTETISSIQTALRADVIEIVGADTYAFIHDRLVEALSASVPEDQRKTIHQNLAETIQRGLTGNEELDRDWYHQLARHYALGFVDRNPRAVFNSNRDAGWLALKNFGQEEAYEFLGRSVSLAEAAQATDSELAAILEPLAEACTRTGRLEEAREHLERALKIVREPADECRLRLLIADALLHDGRPNESWKYMDDALEVLGRPIAKSKLLQRLTYLWFSIVALVLTRTGVGFGIIKNSGLRARVELICRLYERAVLINWVLGDESLYRQLLAQGIVYSHLLGACQEFSMAHGVGAYASASLGLRETAFRSGDLAIEIGRQIGNGYVEWFARRYRFEQVGENIGDNVQAEQESRAMYPNIRKWCGPYDVTASLASNAIQNALRGRSHTMLEYLRPKFPDLENSKNRIFRTWARTALYSQLVMMGEVKEAARVKEEMTRLSGDLGASPVVLGTIYSSEIIALIEQEEFGTRLEDAIDGYEATVQKTHCVDYWIRFGAGAIAEARIAQWERAEGRERKVCRRKARRALHRFAAIAVTPLHRSTLSYLRAYMHVIDGAPFRTHRYLDQAEDFARQADNKLILFAVNVCRARMAQASGRELVAQAEAREALKIAVEQHWHPRRRRLMAEFRLDVEAPRAPGSSSLTSSTASIRPPHAGSTWVAGQTMTFAPAQRHFKALLNVSLASASTLDPQEQARAALDEILNVLGGERAFLWLAAPNSDDFSICIGRDAKGSDITELKKYSTTVVERVRQTRATVVVTGTEQGEIIGSESAVAFDLRSIMAAPLMIRDRLMGVVYVDSHLAKGLFTDEDSEILVAIANHVAIAMETARSARLEAQRIRIESELALTGAVQALFLPQTQEFRTSGAVLRGVYRPAQQCGGDWWWCETPSEGTLWAILGDVTGHGISSAMVTASLATVFQTARAMAKDLGVPDLLEQMHAQLLRMPSQDYLMTAFGMEINHADGSLSWWGAAAPPVLLLGPDGRVSLLSQGGRPLGTRPMTLASGKIHLPPGHRLLAFSDGVSELRRANNSMLGHRRLSKILSKTSGLDVRAACDLIVSELNAFSEETPQDDDITFFIADVI